MNTYEMTLTAGQVWVLDSPGDYFRILDGSAACDVQLTRAGIPVQESKGVLAGLWVQPDGGFTGLRIVNGGTAQTIKLGIAQGKAGYDRLQVSGGVEVSQAATVTNIAPVTVGTAAVSLASALAGRRSLRFQNDGTVDIFIGASGVTTANGIRIAPGDTWVERDAAPAAWFAISGTAGQSVRVQAT